MADVRLTATNPEDSSVVPVACDASGRLLLEERGVGPQGPPGPQGDPGEDGKDGKDGDPFSGNFAGDVTFGGSATFAGKVDGLFFQSVRDTESQTCFEGALDTADDAPVQTSIIKADGSVTFAAGKAGFTSEGYLWCTTRRGDTVILDATSNGMGVWEEYTSFSRINEIRDKLDANRPQTGEMPADTP